MADTTAAPAAPTTPAPAGQGEAPKPTLSVVQGGSNAPAGGAPPAQEPPPQPPQRYKLGSREVTLEELQAAALEAEGLRSGFEKGREALRQAAQLQQALQDPAKLRQLLGDEHARALAVAIAKEHAERVRQAQEEQQLTPEQREVRRLQRELEKLASEREASTKAKEAEEIAKANAQLEQEAVQSIRKAMSATGLPQTPATARRVALQMALNVEHGLNLPPEVVARQVRRQVEQEQHSVLGALGPGDLLGLPGLVDKLNSLDDDGLLEKLRPLGERLRTRNLRALQQGAPPAAAPQQVGPPTNANVPEKLTRAQYLEMQRDWDLGRPGAVNPAPYASRLVD